MITISQLTGVTESSIAELNMLMQELRVGQSGNAVNGVADMMSLLNDKNIIVTVVKDDEKIVGVATLYIIPKIGKTVAYIEDVVVSSAYRGQGLGEKLIREVIEVAKSRNVRSVGLTSRPAREAANKLYQKVGFIRKETNVYKLAL
jgi:ribosomal protein S18 acetylase RimI-like enzyme